MMKKPEILAPVGGAQQLTAAVRSGADAVYLGASSFNARRKADNFGEDALPEAIRYCRERGVKVYIAVNILVDDREIPQLAAFAEELARLGADGVIVQDLAAAKVFSTVCPEMPLHASTQMTVHNKAGVRLLKEYGFCRFVPARELSLTEIKNLAVQTDMETEVFVHGALCMSVSGCCYLSSMLGGRSGNRGLCAQSCRLNFKAAGREYALSLKDMSYIDRIGELTKAGVCSLKIEGRMKRPEYVAAAVDACRKAINGQAYDKELLQKVFSRSGFTDGYLVGKRDLSMFGYRTKEDVVSASGEVFAELHTLYRAERQNIPLSAELIIESEKTVLHLSDGLHTVSASGRGGFLPEKAPISKENAEKNIAKCGGTPYYIDRFLFKNEHELYLPASELNALRRSALELLAGERTKAPYRHVYGFHDVLPEKKHRFKSFYVRFAKARQVFDGDYEKLFLPIDEILNTPELADRFAEKLVAQTPALVFENEEEFFCQKLEKLAELGIKRASAENIGQLQILREHGFEVIGGYGLNILNSVALAEYQRLGLSETVISFETAADKIKELKTDMDITAITYGYLPLMKYRNCPMKTEKGCGSCKGFGFLTDRKNIDFPVICENRRYSVLYNSVPLDVSDRDFSFVDHKLLFFTSETQEDCRRIFEAAASGRQAAEKHTNGLYYRELL